MDARNFSLSNAEEVQGSYAVLENLFNKVRAMGNFHLSRAGVIFSFLAVTNFPPRQALFALKGWISFNLLCST